MLCFLPDFVPVCVCCCFILHSCLVETIIAITCFVCCHNLCVSSGLLPQEAPVNIAEKRKLFLFLSFQRVCVRAVCRGRYW